MKRQFFPTQCMRACALACIAVLLGVSVWAQDKPLGDIAREAQAKKSPSSRPVRVFTNDESNGPAITSNDDPIDVFNKSRAALLRDQSHRCVREASGTQGPAGGWTEVSTTEVATNHRIHFTTDRTDPDSKRSEVIVADDAYYHREGNNPWRKLSAEEAGFGGRFRLPDVFLPSELQFGYNKGDLKLVGSQVQVIDGASTLQYRFDVHSSTAEIDRTVNIWVGIYDHLPRKLDMATFDRRTGSWDREQTTCSVGVNISVEPPI